MTKTARFAQPNEPYAYVLQSVRGCRRSASLPTCVRVPSLNDRDRAQILSLMLNRMPSATHATRASMAKPFLSYAAGVNHATDDRSGSR
jgi:hypothetical protein